MDPKFNINDSGSSNMPERSHKVFTLNEKLKLLNKERKKKLYAKIAKIYSKNNLLSEIMRKETNLM